MINEPTSGVDQEDQGNQEERYVIFVVLGRVVFLCCLVTKQVFFDSFCRLQKTSSVKEDHYCRRVFMCSCCRTKTQSSVAADGIASQSVVEVVRTCRQPNSASGDL